MQNATDDGVLPQPGLCLAQVKALCCLKAWTAVANVLPQALTSDLQALLTKVLMGWQTCWQGEPWARFETG